MQLIFLLLRVFSCFSAWLCACVCEQKSMSLGWNKRFKSSPSTLLTNHALRRPHTHTHTHTQHLQPIQWALAISQVQMKTSNSSSVSSCLPDAITVTQLSLSFSLSLSAIHTHRGVREEEESSVWFLPEISRERNTTAEREGKAERKREMTRGMDSQCWCYQWHLRGGAHRQRRRQTEIDRDSG